MSSTERLLDAAGHQRSPVTMPGYHRGRFAAQQRLPLPGRSANGRRDHRRDARCRHRQDGARLRALVVLLWRAGLRVSEALDLAESDSTTPARRDPDQTREGRQAPRGRDGRLGLGGNSNHGYRSALILPVGALLCVIHGPTGGRRWEAAAARKQLKHAAADRPACEGGSRRISSAMRTRLKWRTKGFRSS